MPNFHICERGVPLEKQGDGLRGDAFCCGGGKVNMHSAGTRGVWGVEKGQGQGLNALVCASWERKANVIAGKRVRFS